jgi:hypothetical protein
MSRKVLTDLDLQYNQLLNTRLQQVAGNPTTLLESLIWYNSSTKRPMYYDGTGTKVFGIDYQPGVGIDITNDVIKVNFNDVATAAEGALAGTALQPGANISLLTDDSATNPIAKANTLTGLTTTIAALNYTDGVTSNIQTQLNGKQSTIDSSHKLLSDLVDDTNQTHKFATSSQLTQISTNANDISDINIKIPSQASALNKLADKDFVNSSISTNTAYFDGTWNTYASIPTTVSGFTSLGLPEPTNNNYLVVKEDETQDGGTWRYKYVDDGSSYSKNNWHEEYEVNETPLTAAQLAALNSGITSTLVTQIGTNESDISSLQTTVAGKQDAISDLSTIRSNASNGQTAYTTIQGFGNIVTHNTGEFATSTQGNKADSAVQKYSTTNPALTQSGGLCTWTVTHNLGTKNVQVTVYETSSGEEVLVDSVRTSTSVVTIKVNSTSNIQSAFYTVIVQGR